MFTENLDRVDSDGTYEEPIQYSVDDEDFNADLSKGISLGVAHELQ